MCDIIGCCLSDIIVERKKTNSSETNKLADKWVWIGPKSSICDCQKLQYVRVIIVTIGAVSKYIASISEIVGRYSTIHRQFWAALFYTLPGNSVWPVMDLYPSNQIHLEPNTPPHKTVLQCYNLYSRCPEFEEISPYVFIRWMKVCYCRWWKRSPSSQQEVWRCPHMELWATQLSDPLCPYQTCILGQMNHSRESRVEETRQAPAVICILCDINL